MPGILHSFIDVPRDSHFPIQNLPFGVFKPAQGPARVGVAIGESILDLGILEAKGKFRVSEFQDREVFAAASLNGFLSLGRPAWRKAREIIQHLLAAETAELRDDATLRESCFSRAERCHDVAPGADRRLHRLLFLLPSRAQRRHDAARSGERAHAELEMAAGGLSRARQLHRSERHGCPPPAWPDQTSRCARAALRPEPEPGL